MIVHCELSVLNFNGEKWSTLYQNLTANVIFRHLCATDRILLNSDNIFLPIIYAEVQQGVKSYMYN
jgi:hypothetical protein